MNRCIKFITVTLGLFLLSACSVFTPVSITPEKTYTLSQINPNSVKTRNTGLTVMISVPTSTPAYDSSFMMYREHPYQLSYFTRNRWIAAPGDMIVPLLVKSLQNSGAYRAVVSAPFPGFSDVRVDVKVLDFYQDFITKPSHEVVTLNIQVVEMASHRILAAKTFSAAVKAPGNDPEGGVKAANEAVAQLLGQISRFVVVHSQHVDKRETQPLSLRYLPAGNA